MNECKFNFSRNLRSVCELQQSIAEICRSLDINRQQFNKYISGQYYPSKRNLRRICDFFNLTEEQFLLDKVEFDNLLAPPKTTSSNKNLEYALRSLPSSTESLARYKGFYYIYTHALGFPGKILRSLTGIYCEDNQFYSKSIEHLWNKRDSNAVRHRYKYRGLVMFLGDRMFVTEYEVLVKNTICHTILVPSHRYPIDTLTGITSGVSSLNNMPKSTRVEYQYLGRRIDIKEALRGCGLYDKDSEEIDTSIRGRLENTVYEDEHFLRAV